ncbi:hypothetical protein ACT7DL_18240 [Bacillus paranthracis]
MTKTVKEHNLKYILFETFSTPKVASVIQKETGAKILRLNHLATISEDDAKNNKRLLHFNGRKRKHIERSY